MGRAKSSEFRFLYSLLTTKIMSMVYMSALLLSQLSWIPCSSNISSTLLKQKRRVL